MKLTNILVYTFIHWKPHIQESFQASKQHGDKILWSFVLFLFRFPDDTFSSESKSEKHSLLFIQTFWSFSKCRKVLMWDFIQNTELNVCTEQTGSAIRLGKADWEVVHQFPLDQKKYYILKGIINSLICQYSVYF